MRTWAVKLVASLAGSFLESEATKPRFSSLTDTFFTLKPTLSPGAASGRDSWCISTDLTSVVRPEGANTTTMPGCTLHTKCISNTSKSPQATIAASAMANASCCCLMILHVMHASCMGQDQVNQGCPVVAMLTLMMPVSTRPTGTVPMPPIL